MNLEFLKPQYLLFLIAIPIIIFVHFYSLKYGRKQALKFANFEAIRRVTGEAIISKNVMLLILRLATVFFLIFVAAGTKVWYMSQTSDYDMVFAIDASSSMLAEDYKPNRFEATKAAITMFLDNLPGQINVGLVSFSGAAFIHSLPTSDIPKLKDIVSRMELQTLGGTDMGSAIITSSNILSGSDKPRVIVLLTDGQSNIGIPPEDALGYIKDYKITIYTIGIGTSEGGLITDIGASFKLDEDTLKQIASVTFGQYFRPVDEQSLRDAFLKISQFKEKEIGKDISLYLLLLALVALLLEWSFANTKYRVV